MYIRGGKRDLSARRERVRERKRRREREREREQRVPPSTIRRPGVAFIHFTRVCYPRTSTIPMHPLGPASGAPIDRLDEKIYAVAIDDRCPQTSAFCYICTLVARQTCDYRTFLLFHFRTRRRAFLICFVVRRTPTEQFAAAKNRQWKFR